VNDIKSDVDTEFGFAAKFVIWSITIGIIFIFIL